ncbi:hypothetical protein [Bifidobacterium parmae]|uniref:DUF559 domain-containing protein n=1 Tax=Bifidobacterium parmae TaxID=361854 RepID=A0A2N5J0K8_9BIFI|nr:hypothetical protein [Bifidobacterium parmae]PLS27727.1 hypothetical protein Uis4E_1413 [Bifidobacterium parmae]
MDTIIDDTNAPGMRETLARRRQDTLRRCRAETERCGKPLLFGMTTALSLHAIPLPDQCTLDITKLHTVATTGNGRTRTRAAHVQAHVWRHASGIIRFDEQVHALHPYHAWAQLAPYLSLEALVILGDAVVCAMHRTPTLARKRDAATILAGFCAHIPKLARFKGRTNALRALPLIMPNVDSPMESKQRLALMAHGVPMPTTNYVVPDVKFASGASMTLDLAWPEHQVAVEYDGDHHRTDKQQWRRDQEKRNLLRSRSWIILEATAGNLANDEARASFAFQVGRELAKRGASVPFSLMPRPLEET